MEQAAASSPKVEDGGLLLLLMVVDWSLWLSGKKWNVYLMMAVAAEGDVMWLLQSEKVT